jgi:hypothetical protein
VLIVFFGGMAEDQNIVQVGKTEIQVFEDVVHETLEGLSGISQTEGHEGEFEQTERSGDSCLLDVIGMSWNLVVGPNPIDFGDGTARKVMGVILDVRDGVAVRNGAGVQSTVVSTRPPTVVFLGHEMECRRPWTLGTPSCSIPQHGVKLCLCHSQAVTGESAWAEGCWWAGCGAYVVCCVVPHLTVRPSWPDERREFSQKAVRQDVSSDDFNTGD